MSYISTYLSNTILETYFSDSLYVGLHSADPTDNTLVALSTEISGNAYTRQSVTFSITNNLAINTTAITFPIATPSGYFVGWVSIWDGPNNDANLLVHGPLNTAATLLLNNQFQFAIGDLSINIS